jgi:hypothetical protein
LLTLLSPFSVYSIYLSIYLSHFSVSFFCLICVVCDALDYKFCFRVDLSQTNTLTQISQFSQNEALDNTKVRPHLHTLVYTHWYDVTSFRRADRPRRDLQPCQLNEMVNVCILTDLLYYILNIQLSRTTTHCSLDEQQIQSNASQA